MTDARSERIGIFGGTFDPIHNGHLHIARELRGALGLDRVIWIPAGRPPHKRGRIVSSDRDRLAMMTLALSDSPGDKISTIEIERSGPSYTADTLEALKGHLAPASLFFLMGEDSLRDLPNWHDPERILQVADVAVAGRPGVDVDVDALSVTLPALQGKVHVVPIRELAISSSEVRRLAKEGAPLLGAVPPAVADYIAHHGLYRQSQSPA